MPRFVGISHCLYCDQPVTGLGLCKRHWHRWYNCRPMEPTTKPKLTKKEQRKRWAENNKEYWNAYRRAFEAKRRLKVLKMYGNKCKCCGETRHEFLAVDHINGGGKKHIKEFANVGAYRRWLLQKKRKGFRVLCHNCNQARGFYGYCPHERER